MRLPVIPLLAVAVYIVLPAAANGNDPPWRARILPERDAQEVADACRSVSSSYTSPISTAEFRGVRSGYEFRTNPFSGEAELHFGIDIRAAEGSPVRAISDGVVLVAGDHRAYSRFVIVGHGHGERAIYSLSAHLQDYHVEEGDVVRQGQRIGAVGETGDATNPHLHFELYRPGPLPHPDFDLIAAAGQTHHSPRGNIYYDPGLLFCATEEVRAADPRIEWFEPTRAPVGARAALGDEHLYTVSGGGTIHALEVASGDELWMTEAGAPVRTSPARDRDRLYAGTARGSLLAVELDDGEIAWERELGDPVIGDVLVSGNRLFAATTGTVYSFDRAGRTFWSQPREEEAFLSVGTEAVLSGGRLITRNERSVVARSIFDGSVAWRFEADAPLYALEVGTNRADIFAVTIDGSVLAINAASGHLRWRRDLGTEMYANPLAVGESVVVAGRDGYVRSLAAEDGTDRWRTHAGAPVNAPVAEIGGRLVVGTDSGELIALNRDSGRVVDRMQLPAVSRILAAAGVVDDDRENPRLSIGVEGRRLGAGDGIYLLRFPQP